jgi:Fe2+ transport system protein B
MSAPERAGAASNAVAVTARLVRRRTTCCPSEMRVPSGRQRVGPIATVALVGNPNVGKSTIFNALTGARQRVGNWPGTTVQVTSGTWLTPAGPVALVDLPGAYSLARSHRPRSWYGMCWWTGRARAALTWRSPASTGRRTVFRATARQALVLELPPYRVPTVRGVATQTWQRLAGFLRKAGGLIVATVAVVWLLMAIPLGSGPGSGDVSGSAFAGVSRTVAPVRRTFDEASGGHATAAVLAFLVFVLAYPPCMATVATQRAEIGWRWTLLGIGGQLVVAWSLATLVFQIGRLVA